MSSEDYLWFFGFLTAAIVLTLATVLLIVRVRKIRRDSYLWWSYLTLCLPLIIAFYFSALPFFVFFLGYLFQ